MVARGRWSKVKVAVGRTAQKAKNMWLSRRRLPDNEADRLADGIMNGAKARILQGMAPDKGAVLSPAIMHALTMDFIGFINEGVNRASGKLALSSLGFTDEKKQEVVLGIVLGAIEKAGRYNNPVAQNNILQRELSKINQLPGVKLSTRRLIAAFNRNAEVLGAALRREVLRRTGGKSKL